jgi:Family of unknown function (DUF6252)
MKPHAISKVTGQLLILAAAIMFGTGSDCDSKPTNPTVTSFMTANIDARSWSATRSITGSFTNGTLNITGISNEGDKITIAALPTGPGTYVIEGVGGAGLSFLVAVQPPPQTWQAYSLNGSGTLQLSVLSAQRASGTFTFTALPTIDTGADGTKVVTNGTFDVLFQ